MPKPDSFGSIHLDVEPGRETQPEKPEPDTPFRIAILGDFSGRANRGLMQPAAVKRAIAIDRDNFDEVLARLAPELHLPVPGAPGKLVRARFRELDDFHPDRIFERVELFQALRQTRQKLGDRATFAAVAAELQGPARAPAPQPGPAPQFSLEDLFEESVQETQARTGERAARAVDDFGALVRDLVAPHLAPRDDPRQAEMIAQVDAATAAQMRAFLHQRDFQALEAAWRVLFFLLRRIETGTDLKVLLIDISKAELAAGLTRTDDLRTSMIYRLLVEQTVGTPGADPWAVLAGNYFFDNSIEDVELLGRLALLAAAAGAPFLAGASPRILGCRSFGSAPEVEQWRPNGKEAWIILREMPEARWIGLALPRFLLRLPYGKETDPIEHFDFEEFDGPPEHENYLWANAAFACVCLLGQAFSEFGWEMHAGAVREIEGLPGHVYAEDGESNLKPCAEAVLTVEAAERIIDAGLMPLLSFKGRDTVRLARFQSVADPPAALAGRWGSETGDRKL